MGESLSRKERRKIEEQRTFYRNMKKSAAVLGTTITAISAVAPLSPIVTVLADETDTVTEEISANTMDTNSQESDEAVIEEVAETDVNIEETLPTDEVIIEEEIIPESSEIIEELPEQSIEEIVPEVVEPIIEEASVEVAAPFAAPAAMRSRAAMDPQAFISMVSQHAVSIANANDLYASVMIAQAIIESGWGGSTLSQAPNYNLFGIKGSYQGQTVYMSTLEYLNGQWVTKNEPFRKYPSFAESFADNAYTLRNVSLQHGVYYYAGAWKSNTTSYRDATAWLTGRYATDPSYASKLNNVIEAYQLTRFDTLATGNPTTPSVPEQPSNPGNSNSQGSATYTVKSGDSVWSIANRHGITMDQLRSWNNIKGDLIHPGQKLVVKKGATDELTPLPPVENPNPPTNVGTGQKPSTSNQTYTVKSGDSIWLIANNHGISMDQLRSWNNIKGDFIYPGQKLIVKKGTGSTTNPTPPKNPAKPTPPTNMGTGQKPSTSNQTYTVKSGDSVWLIANNHGISMDQLRSLNNIKGDLIHPGQKLIIKKSTANTVNVNNQVQNKPVTPSNNQSHKVVSGDSLWAISERYGVSIQQLKTTNNLKSDIIYVGQTLKV